MLHIMKLAVGVPDVAALRRIQAERAASTPPLRHLTRSMPRRADELLGDGSLYWVVAGALVVRQRLLALRPDQRPNGEPCCALVLDPLLVPVEARPVKAFQGWRYLDGAAAPADLRRGGATARIPETMAAELRILGLL